MSRLLSASSTVRKIFLILSFLASDFVKIFLCRSIEKLVLINGTSWVWLCCLLNFSWLYGDMDSFRLFCAFLECLVYFLWTLEQFHPCQLMYFGMVFLPDFCSSKCLDRFLNCTLYQAKIIPGNVKMIFILVTTRPAVQGNFAINVTVCSERSRVMTGDAVGLNVASLSLPLAALWRASHSPLCNETRWSLSQLFLKQVLLRCWEVFPLMHKWTSWELLFL